MKKITCGKNIELASYDADNLEDVAHSIFDWMDGLDNGQVREIVGELKSHDCLNKKGEALLKEMDNIIEAEFQREKTICSVCKEEIRRENYSELMLNPQMELIPLCPKHFAEEYHG